MRRGAERRSGAHQVDVDVSLETSRPKGPGSVTEFWRIIFSKTYLDFTWVRATVGVRVTSHQLHEAGFKERKHDPVQDKVEGAAVWFSVWLLSSFWPTCWVSVRGGWSWWERCTRAQSWCRHTDPALIINNIEIISENPSETNLSVDNGDAICQWYLSGFLED